MHEDFALADADLSRAETLDPNLPNVWLTRSRLRMTQKQFAEAEQEADRVLAKVPESGPAWILKARALAEEKRLSESANAWQKALAAAKAPDVELYFECGNALAAAGEDRIEAALRVFDDGLARLGNVPTLALAAIELETRRGKYDAALSRIERAIPKSGRIETWIERRADILAKAGRKDEAKRDYERALAALAAAPERARATEAAKKLEERLRQKLADAQK
jgi:tetratricopeptide (TPR) repeat protein